MENRLPIKLNKEPLVDAIFEVRFESDFPASEVLVGVLFSQLEGNKTVSSLPVSQIPSLVRKANSDLQFAPVSRLEWDHFFVNCGDQSLSVGCKLPYPGWAIFKYGIIQVLNKATELNIIKSISRYALKYIDLIPSATTGEQISLLNLNLSIANHALKKENFQVRVEIPKDGYINAIQLISSATVKTSDGVTREGAVVDIDTIKNVSDVNMQQLMDNLPAKLEEIHLLNKTIFFDCLKSDTLTALEPEYAAN